MEMESMTTLSLHRELQLGSLVYSCECQARVLFRCAANAASINNRTAQAHFKAKATQALRIAQRAALRMGL